MFKKLIKKLMSKRAEFALHFAHAGWLFFLPLSVNEDGVISSYWFLLLWAGATLIEILRWEEMGRTEIEFQDGIRSAPHLDAIVRFFLHHSFYVAAPLASSAVMEAYVGKESTRCRKTSTFGREFARFWLRSDAAPMLFLLLALLLSINILNGLGWFNLGQPRLAAQLFWLIEFSLLSKCAAIVCYSVFVLAPSSKIGQ